MKLLLDTHIFLWYISAASQLPARLRDAIADPANVVYLSAVSVWEATIKFQLGKLPLPEPPHVYLPRARAQHGILTLPVDEASVIRLTHLPALHRDPFDRLLICQALEHGLTIATVDDQIRGYSVAIIS